ncbi:hypothetical protein Lser_V15G25687 [Lactuca serriola]
MNSEIKQQKVVKHRKHARLTKKARPEDSMSMVAESFQNNEHIHLLSTVDVSVSLSVNRSGRLENNATQYSVDIESIAADIVSIWTISPLGIPIS